MKTVLCIDDQIFSLEIRKMFLESFGYFVHIASSGRQGLELLGQHEIDAVILDLRMPDMDGCAVAQEIHRRYPGLPILLLTGYPSSVTDEMRGLVNGLVVKGSPAPELLARVAALVGGAPEKPDLAWQRAARSLDLSTELARRNERALRKPR